MELPTSQKHFSSIIHNLQNLFLQDLFLSFLDFLIHYIFETNLRLFSILQRNLDPSRILATPGIVLFVTLVKGFQPWSNVRKISVLDVVGILDTSLYLVYKFLCNFIFTNIFCIFVFIKTK